MNTHSNTGSLIQVTEHPVTPDTEHPGCIEREKVAPQSRQDKGIPQAGKKGNIFTSEYWRKRRSNRKKKKKKDSPLMQPRKTANFSE